MPADVTCLQLEQLADVDRASERVLQGLSVDVDRRRGHELAVDLGEQERAFGQPPAVERGQALERDLVAHAAEADQDRPLQLQLICAQLLRAEGPWEMGRQVTD